MTSNFLWPRDQKRAKAGTPIKKAAKAAKAGTPTKKAGKSGDTHQKSGDTHDKSGDTHQKSGDTHQFPPRFVILHLFSRYSSMLKQGR